MPYEFLDEAGRGRQDTVDQAPPVAPGKVALTARLLPRESEPAGGAPSVQRDAARGCAPFDPDPFSIHLLAAHGVAGGGAPLPHAEAIQQSFGHHDMTGVRAHVGGAAAEAAGAIGASAYATGDDVAFEASPDLRQAAHEAAHVVQQRGGVRLDGGVGRSGDPYEQHADAVAALVVRGESAEALLDTMAHRGAAGGAAVQRDDRDSDGVGIDPALQVHLTALATLTVPQLEAIVAAIPRRDGRRDPAGVYPVPFGDTQRDVLGAHLDELRAAAHARAHTRQNHVESHQDWGRYSRALDAAAPERSPEDDPARATAIRAVGANTDLGLHDSVIVALWRVCCPNGTARDRGHGYFTRTLTDAMATLGVPDGVLDEPSVRALHLGERIVPASTRGYGAGAIAALTEEQIRALIERLGAPAGSITRTEHGRRAATVTIAREFWVAASEWQVFALVWTGRPPDGRLSREDLEQLVPGLAPEEPTAEEPVTPGGAARQAAGATTETEPPPGSSRITAAQRAQIEAWRHDLETTRNPPEPAAPELLDARGRTRRPTRAERHAAASTRAESINAALTTLLDGTILPGMRRLGVADWSSAQMLRGSDTITRWVNRVFTALGQLTGAIGTSAADADARSELERGDYVTGAATLRRAGWDRRLSTSHVATDEEGRHHRVIDATPEERAPAVTAALTTYRALVTRLNAAVDRALAGIVARPDEAQRTAAIAGLQEALRKIERHFDRSATKPWDHQLHPVPTLLRHSIRVAWPSSCNPAETDYAALLQQVRSWDHVFNDLLARSRRGHTSIEEAERATLSYGEGINNVNPDAVFVDLHRTGVELTNNHGNTLSPDETRSGAESSSMSMHLDPVFALNMSRFLEGLARRGVTRMWTSGFLRSAMSPADTHPKGMACDITGFTFSSGDVIHLRSGQPTRDHGDGTLPDAPAGPSAWFDTHHTMNGQTYAHVIMGLTALMPTYFDRIIGPGANAEHMAHWHVENSPNGPPRDGLRLHAVSSESTHVPEFMRDAADRRSDDWASATPIPLTAEAVLLGPATPVAAGDSDEGASGSED